MDSLRLRFGFSGSIISPSVSTGSRILGEAKGLAANEGLDVNVHEVLVANDRVIVDVQGVADELHVTGSENDAGVDEDVEGEEAKLGGGSCGMNQEDGNGCCATSRDGVASFFSAGGLILSLLRYISTCVDS